MINMYINQGTGYRTALIAAAALVIGGCATAKPEKAEMAAAAPAVETEIMMKEVILEADKHFKFDSAELIDEDGIAALDNMIAEGEADGTVGGEVIIEAYADTDGDAGYNKMLSQKRADAIKGYLVSKGVPGSAITAIGMGETSKFAQCDQSNFAERKACNQPNRVGIVKYGIVQSEEVIKTTN